MTSARRAVSINSACFILQYFVCVGFIEFGNSWTNVKEDGKVTREKSTMTTTTNRIKLSNSLF